MLLFSKSFIPLGERVNFILYAWVKIYLIKYTLFNTKTRTGSCFYRKQNLVRYSRTHNPHIHICMDCV